MYPVTKLCRQALTDPARQTELYIRIKKSDGSIVHIEGAEHVRLGSFSIESQIWGNTLQLGSCIASDLSMTLDNVDGNWRVDEMLGATLFPFIRVKLNGQLIEEIPLGAFIVDRPGSHINVLTIKAADRLVLLDEPLKDAVNSLHTTNADLLHDICNYCKVPVSARTYQVLNMGHQISLKEIPDSMTCRDAVSEIALLAGGFARMNRQGELEIISLDVNNKLANSEIWGQQRLKRNTWGALKTAGKRWVDLNGLTNRTTYGRLKQNRVTWGELKRRGIPWQFLKNFDVDAEDLKNTWLILPNARYDSNQDTEPLTITGMAYKDIAWGTNDYVLELKNIQLLADDKAETVLTPVWQSIKGLRYVPFSASYIGNPALDAGDLVWHMGRNGLSLVSFVGKHTYRHNGKSKISSGGKSKQELNYKTQNERRLVELSAQTKQVKADLTEYQQSTAHMADMLTQALGVYGPTAVQQDSEAYIYYLHNKPTLAESKTIWRFDGQWLAISDDGGQSWSGGISAQSKLVMRVIDAVKISADQIKAGAITTEKIAAGAVTAQEIAANAVTASKIQSRSIGAEKIKAGAITSYEIAANTITANEIKSNSIGAAQIKVDEILGTNATFSGTIRGAKIIASSIQTTSLTAGSINGNYMSISTNGSSHSRYQRSDYMSAWNMSAYSATAQTFNFQSGKIQSGVDIGNDMHVSSTGIFVNGAGYVCSFETVGNAWLALHRGNGNARFSAQNLIWAVTTSGQVVTSDLATKKDLKKISHEEAISFVRDLSYWKYRRKCDDVERLGIVANFLKYSKSPLAKYVLNKIDGRDGFLLGADYDQLAIINAAALKAVEERVTELEAMLKV